MPVARVAIVVVVGVVVVVVVDVCDKTVSSVAKRTGGKTRRFKAMAKRVEGPYPASIRAQPRAPIQLKSAVATLRQSNSDVNSPYPTHCSCFLCIRSSFVKIFFGSKMDDA